MRRLLWLGACALGMLCATAVHADVRRAPLRVQWVGPAPTVEAGKPVTGTLRFLSSNPVTITNVRFEGTGWSGRVVQAPPSMSLAAPGALQVRFEATGKDVSKPLVLRFEADGVAREELLDFAAAAAVQPGTTRQVPQAYDPFRPLGQTFARPDPAGADDAFTVWGKADRSLSEPAGPSATQARNIRVHGRFTYDRSDGQLMGVDGATVHIYDEDTGSDELLATLATDAYGYYDVTFYWDPCAVFCDQQPDIYVRFESANTEINVRTTGLFGGTYAWVTGTTNDYAGSDLDKGWQTPGDEAQHPSLHVLTDLTRDWRWYLNREGYNLPSITAYWPDGASGAWYDDGEPAIHVGDDRRWREDSHAHEYGHHWIYTYAVGQVPDYCNGICDSPGNCGHCIWCQETNHDAWNEGWPNWICHVQTTSYEGDYGIESMNTRDEESVGTCGGSLDDPTITEGFIGALMQDIWDATNEDDGGAPGTWQDRLSLGYNEVFTVADVDHPLNPLDFITKFRNRYPSYKEQLWETAKNNTFEVDAANPSVVTNLTSPSHPVGSDLPDPTVQFTWTRANDDWSGPSGYSITVQAVASLPDQTQDIGDVTTWTSGVLSPGTYRFNIRTRDRSGKWSGSYATYGPFTIRTPEPANLTDYLPAGWTYPTVPRSTNDGTWASMPPPTAPLPGGSASTYWNVAGVNNGESSTSIGFTTRCYVDEVYRTGASWGTIGAGGLFYAPNWGPFTVQGGRHTMESQYDYFDAIAETDETDNRWGHQWIWSPLVVASNTTVNRAAPPLGDAGWGAIVDGSVLWFNADGLRFNTLVSGQWWHAIYAYATNLDEDYDCRLHFATGSADTGFAGNHGYSARAAGYLDAVLVNRNQVGSPTNWDVGVLNRFGGSSSYVAREVASSILTFGDSVNVTMGSGEMMLLREFYLGSGNVGAVSITARILSGTGPVYLQWRNQNFSLGDLGDYSAQATAVGATTARIDASMPDQGWQGICLYRDPRDGTDPVTLVLEISLTPPDFTPYFAAGWHSPFVPRPANDGTPGSVPLPDTLYGNMQSTYMNFAVRNDSPTGQAGLLGQAYIDGIYSAYLAYGFFGGNASSLFNWEYAWTIRGGRHTFSVYYDQVEQIEEKFEDNNVYGEQFVWSPYPLSFESPLTRVAPPDRSGGWDQVRSGEAFWYNVDGLRMPAPTHPGGANYWMATAVMPGPASDVDLRLHDLSPGTKGGFGPSHGVSGWGTGQSDYCLVDFNSTPAAAYDAGVLRWEGTQAYTSEMVGSVLQGSYPDAIYGPFTLGANHILRLHEFFLVAGTYAVDVINEDGTVDWGVNVHGPGAFQTKSSAVAGGSSWFGGPGESELCTAGIPAAGWYCVAVWKAGNADLGKTGSYRLQVRPLTVDAPYGVPARTALGPTYPNPVHDALNVGFDLATSGSVRLEVYDLHGARVRTLVNESRDAGSWQVRWTGDDESGRTVAPGVYFVRLQSNGVSESRRVVKMQ